ncbi:MAG: hypothetical protein MZV64_28680 [Ignavibacteriales bacterium]|nr:hypothetical protein [Ignavibacteriales bacterium]
MISVFQAPDVAILYDQPARMDVRVGLDAGTSLLLQQDDQPGGGGYATSMPRACTSGYATLQSFLDGEAPREVGLPLPP